MSILNLIFKINKKEFLEDFNIFLQEQEKKETSFYKYWKDVYGSNGYWNNLSDKDKNRFLSWDEHLNDLFNNSPWVDYNNYDKLGAFLIDFHYDKKIDESSCLEIFRIVRQIKPQEESFIISEDFVELFKTKEVKNNNFFDNYVSTEEYLFFWVKT